MNEQCSAFNTIEDNNCISFYSEEMVDCNNENKDIDFSEPVEEVCIWEVVSMDSKGIKFKLSCNGSGSHNNNYDGMCIYCGKPIKIKP
jgi:hypothetical protein